MSFAAGLLAASALLFPLKAQYHFQPFSVQGLATYAQGINNRGAVVGYYGMPGNILRAFKRHADGTIELVEVPELFYDSLTLNGINNNGDVVGSASFSIHGFTSVQSFKLSGGPNRTLEYIAYPYDDDPFANTFVYGTNNGGDAVVRESNFGGFVYSGGTYSAIAFPGVTSFLTTPYGIAFDGTLVGCYFSPHGRQVPFLRGPHGRFLALIFDNVSACAFGISNPVGKIAGSFQDAQGKWHGFVYDYQADLGGVGEGVTAARTIPVQVVDYPGATRTEIRGIDGQGLIAGWANLSGGTTVSFIGTPQP